MGAIIVALGCLSIFGSTTYMAATCTTNCPVMVDTTTSAYTQEPAIAPEVPQLHKTTIKDYYVVPNPAQF